MHVREAVINNGSKLHCQLAGGFLPIVGALGDIDVEKCRIGGGTARVKACIEYPVVIKKILTYLEEKSPTRAARLLPDSQAPPQSSLFG
jgi:hypothetical protein